MTARPFGQVLSDYLHAKGMKASDLARRMGVSDAAVSRWKAGRVPDTVLLVTLADILGIPPKDLLGSDFVAPLPAEPSPRQGRPPRAEPDVASYLDAVKGEPLSTPTTVKPGTTRSKPGRATPR